MQLSYDAFFPSPNFDTRQGQSLFFVSAREAGQTGRFRLTFTKVQ